jgi:hypothetical protein
MKKLLLVTFIFLTNLCYGEEINLICKSESIFRVANTVKITTFPNSLISKVFVDGKELGTTDINDIWTFKLEDLKITPSTVEFVESMKPPKEHRMDWVNSRSIYSINRLNGVITYHREEFDGKGNLIHTGSYYSDKCESVKPKF